jgi:hypothetical protein
MCPQPPPSHPCKIALLIALTLGCLATTTACLFPVGPGWDRRGGGYERGGGGGYERGGGHDRGDFRGGEPR